MKIHETLKKLLKNKQISQIELAEKIGKSTTAVSQILTGAYNPTHKTLEKIAVVLNMPVTAIYLLSLDEKDLEQNKRDMYKALYPAIYNLFVD